MKTLFLLTIPILMSCSHGIKSTCIPQAVTCAWIWEQETKQPARIVIYHVSPSMNHAQAEGWNGKEWIPLKVINNRVFKTEKEGNKIADIYDLQRLLNMHKMEIIKYAALDHHENVK